MPEFFPLGKKHCPVAGPGKECSNLGVWYYECCGTLYTDCCGKLSIAGWILIGALAVIVILIIVGLVCRKK
ncbi:hypothetical protein RB195_017025 [Necator americanus]|uniref:Uncharacterized protein n=1 Tax=Necator americanus TaxID=51031 RepID=A0ABR1C5C4_NECAM